MSKHIPQGNIQLTWHDIAWRVVLTGLLLVALANTGFALFEPVTTRSGVQVPPILAHETDRALAR